VIDPSTLLLKAGKKMSTETIGFPTPRSASKQRATEQTAVEDVADKTLASSLLSEQPIKGESGDSDNLINTKNESSGSDHLSVRPSRFMPCQMSR